MSENDHILAEGARFFSEIYSELASQDTISHINVFLPQNYKQISLQDHDFLSKQLTVDELFQALKGMKNGKSPGSDRFTVEFYKKCWDLVAPHMYAAFMQSF